MHMWGHWPDELFIEVSDAAQYIGSFLRRWGRVPVRDTKEKFGCVRCYCSFGWTSVHDLTHPGWAYIQYPEPWRRLYYSTLGLQGAVFTVLNVVVRPYHQWLYGLAHKRAIAKWPHIRAEILGSPDFDEYLVGL